MSNFLIESTSPIVYDYYSDFIHFVCDELGIDHDIPVSFISKTGTASFGNYHPGTRQIQVAVDGRHIADILRTLAHELVHEAQHSNGTPDEPLDRLEYEANALAGMLMREYNRLHPELYDGEDEVDPDELDDTGGVGAAQGSLENAGITVDAFQTPSYEYEGLSDAQPMRPAYPVELAELNNKTLASYKRKAKKNVSTTAYQMSLGYQPRKVRQRNAVTGNPKTMGREVTNITGDDIERRETHIKNVETRLRKYYNPESLKEDAGVNTAGSGAVAGIGVGPQGEPGVLPQKKKTPMFKRKTLADFRKKK